jgi:aerotaxis receptor
MNAKGKVMKSEQRRRFVNIITRESVVQPIPNSIEKHYDGKSMITETDAKGNITYASKRFCDMTGYDRKTLVGMPHSIVRHPDMPVGLFKGLWNTILDKKIWRGYIKSLCKDGSYFWALVYIQPKLDDDGNILGFVATRKDAYPKTLEEIKAKYEELQGPEHIDDPYFSSFELYFGDDIADFTKRA